ncbi:hypothetical protein GCM10008955_15300 [Deinococcus malanensis]|uniref:Uncharacterized protein n=1 Tax=Deinococcus malanensis TaxID=1706855 RepID=A0ABQ2ERU7_9DEIO|nr:hypothetical protein [Deinococcus malanensis]GGK22761.1 hypothetical protein GCM10008955_15300 [Deinococcus malanensis]
MPCHTPKVYVTVVHTQTGEIVRHLGPYASAAAARTACGTAAGQLLVWTRREQDWVVEKYPLEYRVQVDESAAMA